MILDKYAFANTDFNAHKKNQSFQNTYDFLIEKWGQNPRFQNYLITLDADDLNIIHTVAQQRFDNNRKLGRSGGNIEREILGTSGEYATLKYLKENGFEIQFDRFWDSVNVKMHYRDDCDAELIYNDRNYRLEVKTTPKPLNAKLLVPEHQYNSRKHSEIYILTCRLSDNVYCIKGFAAYNEFRFDDTLQMPGYSIPEKALHENIFDVL